MKKKNLDAYVSFVQSMHISTASRRNMMQMLLDESAELPEPAVTRRRDPAAAWLRFERISGIAAVLIVGISAALLIHSAVRSAPPETLAPVVCSVPEQLTDTAFADYFAAEENAGPLTQSSVSLAVSSYNACISMQQTELKRLQREQERLGSEPDDGRLLNPWYYLQPANTMHRTLLWLRQCEPENAPLRTAGIGYCEEEALFYFTLINLADEDAVFRTDVTLRDYDKNRELVHDTVSLPLWQRGFLTEYLCQDPLRELPDKTGYCITIPAHSAAELTLHIPADTDIMRDRIALELYGNGSEPAYTKYFAMNEKMLLMPRQQEKELLDFAAEHSELEY